MSNAVVIRPAVAADGARLVEMLYALLAHLGDDPTAVSREQFLADAFGEQPQFRVFVAESHGRVEGYALFHDAYEPAYSAKGVYLCDIFVEAGLRRHGVGRELIAAVAADAADRGRTFVWWVARGDDARLFYRRLDAVEQPVTAHALTFAAFDALALASRARGPLVR